MASQPGTERPFQFSLRSLLLFVLGFALSIPLCRALWHLAHDNTVDVYYIAAIVGPITVALFCYFMGRVLSGLVRSLPKANVVTVILWIFLVTMLAATCYATWCRNRWPYIASDYSRLKPWPYPDFMLLAYHNWLDACSPPPPGSIKLHGEFYTVLEQLDRVVISFVAVTAAILGLVAPILPSRLLKLAKMIRGACQR